VDDGMVLLAILNHFKPFDTRITNSVTGFIIFFSIVQFVFVCDVFYHILSLCLRDSLSYKQAKKS
jgi:hypothetical protein